MPRITKISVQQKRDDRFSVYIDGRYAFSLSDLELAVSGIRVDQEVDSKKIVELKSQSTMGKALDRAYNFLSYRPRSEKEVVDYLKKKEYPEEIEVKVLAKLHTDGYLNDTEFAKSWVRERQLSNPRSKQHLQQELRQKGIDAKVISEVLAGLDTDAEVSAITELVQKKRLLNRYDDSQKLMAYLAGKGFRYGDIKKALEGLDV